MENNQPYESIYDKILAKATSSPYGYADEQVNGVLNEMNELFDRYCGDHGSYYKAWVVEDLTWFHLFGDECWPRRVNSCATREEEEYRMRLFEHVGFAAQAAGSSSIEMNNPSQVPLPLFNEIKTRSQDSLNYTSQGQRYQAGEPTLTHAKRRVRAARLRFQAPAPGPRAPFTQMEQMDPSRGSPNINYMMEDIEYQMASSTNIASQSPLSPSQETQYDSPGDQQWDGDTVVEMGSDVDMEAEPSLPASDKLQRKRAMSTHVESRKKVKRERHSVL